MQKSSISLYFACLMPALSLVACAKAAPADDGFAHPAKGSCVRSAGAWSTAEPYAAKLFGSYQVSNDNFNNTPGQTLWANSESCFGVSTLATTERSGIGSYPHVVRGWSQTQTEPQWATKSGLGIPVEGLRKAKIRWSFSASTETGSRWMALEDIYFHKTANPAAGEFPPFIDLMVDQAMMDQVVGSSTYFALVADRNHGVKVTLGGNSYLVYVDDPGEVSFHQAGGHTIHLLQYRTATTAHIGTHWGVESTVTDLAAIVRYFMQASPKDDAGNPLVNAGGVPISAPLIPPGVFLTAINVGWEIDVGTQFQTDQFWVALQDEAEGQ